MGVQRVTNGGTTVRFRTKSQDRIMENFVNTEGRVLFCASDRFDTKIADNAVNEKIRVVVYVHPPSSSSWTATGAFEGIPGINIWEYKLEEVDGESCEGAVSTFRKRLSNQAARLGGHYSRVQSTKVMFLAKDLKPYVMILPVSWIVYDKIKNDSDVYDESMNMLKAGAEYFSALLMEQTRQEDDCDRLALGAAVFMARSASGILSEASDAVPRSTKKEKNMKGQLLKGAALGLLMSTGVDLSWVSEVYGSQEDAQDLRSFNTMVVALLMRVFQVRTAIEVKELLSEPLGGKGWRDECQCVHVEAKWCSVKAKRRDFELHKGVIYMPSNVSELLLCCAIGVIKMERIFDLTARLDVIVYGFKGALESNTLYVDPPVKLWCSKN